MSREARLNTRLEVRLAALESCDFLTTSQKRDERFAFKLEFFSRFQLKYYNVGLRPYLTTLSGVLKLINTSS